MGKTLQGVDSYEESTEMFQLHWVSNVIAVIMLTE